MEQKINWPDKKFIPDIHIVDYPSEFHKKVNHIDRLKMDDISKSLRDLIEKNNIHVILNNYIYISVHKNGVPIDKQFRIKVDGDVYNTLMKKFNGQLPRHIELVEAESLDINEIYGRGDIQKSSK